MASPVDVGGLPNHVKYRVSVLSLQWANIRTSPVGIPYISLWLSFYSPLFSASFPFGFVRSFSSPPPFFFSPVYSSAFYFAGLGLGFLIKNLSLGFLGGSVPSKIIIILMNK
jgi:hypothetical protein